MAGLDPATIKATLRAHGLSPSAPRVAIYAWLQTHHVHPTVDVIYRALRPQLKSLSRTTVYNVLHAFVEKGLANVIRSEDLELRYDGLLSPHAHFKCTQCGAVIDLGAIPATLGETVGLPKGTQPTELAVLFRGLCAACAIKRTANSGQRTAADATDKP